MSSPIPETELITRAQNGDTHAFAQLYKATVAELTASVTGKLYRAGLHRLHADDVVQETYLRAYRVLPRYEDQGRPFIAYLHTIAGNLIFDALKSHAHRRELPFTHIATASSSPTDVWYDRAAPQHERPDERTVLADDFGRLVALIPELTELQQEVLLNRHYYCLSVEETAREMGVSPQVVKVRCAAAIASLRRLYAAAYPVEVT